MRGREGEGILQVEGTSGGPEVSNSVMLKYGCLIVRAHGVEGHSRGESARGRQWGWAPEGSVSGEGNQGCSLGLISNSINRQKSPPPPPAAYPVPTRCWKLC